MSTIAKQMERSKMAMQKSVGKLEILKSVNAGDFGAKKYDRI